jgi:hypothetical protein
MTRQRKWHTVLESDGSCVRLQSDDGSTLDLKVRDERERSMARHWRKRDKFCQKYVEEVRVLVFAPGTWFEQDFTEAAKREIARGKLIEPDRVEKSWM